jgi:phosphohistidine phosphatase SixA
MCPFLKGSQLKRIAFKLRFQKMIGMKLESTLWVALVIILLPSCHSVKYKITEKNGTPVRQITTQYIVFKDGSKSTLPFATDEKATHLVLVRHAEKAFGEDAPLLAEGKRRALMLADILNEFPLDTIYATRYQRTQLTAQPTARRQSKELAIYNHEVPRDLIQRIKNKHKGYRILVAGHSNTTPELINKFIGKEVLEKIDERDYNNLFVLSINSAGEMELQKLNYSFDKEISD